jgi:membrane-bound ClpP family serine protease
VRREASRGRRTDAWSDRRPRGAHGVEGMYANAASAILIIIGALFAVLGLFAGGNLVVAVIGLVAILAGGALSLAARRSP